MGTNMYIYITTSWVIHIKELLSLVYKDHTANGIWT